MIKLQILQFAKLLLIIRVTPMKLFALLLSFTMFWVGLTRETKLYELLEVTETATSDEMKKAFRRLSIKFHPDRNAGNEENLKKYVEIKRAYQTLIDVSKRITYDIHGQAGLKQLEKNPLQKGGDYRTEMNVPLAKFYTGGPDIFAFRRGQICKHCKGTGDTSKQRQKCSHCDGTGKMFREVKVKNEVKKIEMKCKECSGSGFAPSSRCPVCGGQKITLQPRDLHFEVERGMKNGDVVLFKGESEQGFNFYPGDVYVRLNELPHPTFKRVGNDLQISMDISLKQAILGFSRHINHLDGHEVLIEEDINIQDGDIITVEGKGMPIRGELEKYGNLLAKIDIELKKSFTDEQKRKIKKIFDAGRESGSQL